MCALVIKAMCVGQPQWYRRRNIDIYMNPGFGVQVLRHNLLDLCNNEDPESFCIVVSDRKSVDLVRSPNASIMFDDSAEN